MTKKDNYIIKYNISDSKPKDPGASLLLAIYFSNAIKSFLNSNFKGCIRVESGEFGDESVLVCADYVAYLFKLLLTDIYGRVFLNVSIESNEFGLVLTIKPSGSFPITDVELRRIVKTARNAGMEIIDSAEGLTLTLKYRDAKKHKVYAISVADGECYLTGKLCEIFYAQ